tara:strand:+ start:6593 stop:7177 length:585 start_codon:yes stop_codon:yes gene_type:complete
MSSVANSDIDIASRALILIGAEPITSFTSDTTEALVASNLYEDTVRTALCASRWRFATNQAQLNQLTATPTGRFDVAHQLPQDMLMLHAVTIDDQLIEYTIYGNKLFHNVTATNPVIADYTFRADEVNFPSYFTLAVEYALAASFALAIARDEAMGQMMERKAQQLMQQAKTLDSQQQTTRKLVTSRFITERRS